MEQDQDVKAIVLEYQEMINRMNRSGGDDVASELMTDAGWTHRAAEHLASLAANYGTFFLRNALALSIVLGIEDGELGF